MKAIPHVRTLPRPVFLHTPCSLLAGFQLGLASGRHQYYEAGGEGNRGLPACPLADEGSGV